MEMTTVSVNKLTQTTESKSHNNENQTEPPYKASLP